MTRTANAIVDERMEAEGRTREFIEIREQLKRWDVPDRVAWIVTANLLPPLDGSPVEIECPAQYAAAVSKWAGRVPQMPTFPPGTSTPKYGPQARQYQDAPTGILAEFLADFEDMPQEYEDEWDKLAAQVDATRECGTDRARRWVYENYGKKPEFIAPAEVPSIGALRHLQHVMENKRNYDSFLKDFMAKTVPNKEQGDGEKFADDGREQFRLLDELEKSLEVGET